MSRRSLIATILVTAVVTALVTVSTTRAVVGQGLARRAPLTASRI